MPALTVNGQTRELNSSCSLEDALQEWGFQGKHFAVAVSGNFVPRHQYESFVLKGGECLEVLSPMQGG